MSFRINSVDLSAILSDSVPDSPEMKNGVARLVGDAIFNRSIFKRPPAGWENPVIRFRAAKVCVEEDPEYFLEFLHCFSLSSEDTFEIILTMAKSYTQFVCKKLSEYQFTKAQWRELAEVCARSSPYDFVDCLERFDLDPNEILKIAKICAEKYPPAFLDNTEKFASLSLEGRFEVVRICAEKSPGELARQIHKFHLSFQQQYEIAHHIAKNEFRVLSENAQNFSLPVRPRLELANTYLEEAPDAALQWIGRSSLELASSDNLIFKSILHRFCREMTKPEHVWAGLTEMEIFRHLEDPVWLHEEDVEPLVKYLDIVKVIQSVGSAFAVRTEMTERMLRSVRSPELKLLLLESLIECENCNPLSSVFHRLAKLLKHQEYYQRHSEFLILCVLVARLVSLEVIDTQEESIFLSALYDYIKKDSSKLKSIIYVLVQIINNPSFNKGTKLRLLRFLIPEAKNLPRFREVKLEALQSLMTLFHIRMPHLLLENESPIILVRGIVETIFPDMHYDQIISLFGDERGTYPLICYAAKMKSYSDAKLIEDLTMFVRSVAGNSFAEMRYDMQKNPHLYELSMQKPGIVSAWKMALAPVNIDSDFIAVDTDLPQDLLLFGTEVATCQDIVNGRASLNRGVLGTLLNGQTRLLCVKDKMEGRILARSVLRLLWDYHNPVLYLETFYGDERRKSDIIALAKQKAKQMGLLLVGNEDMGDQSYHLPLVSLGGVACEYCDGSEGGISEDGSFTIQTSYIIR